MTKPIVVVIPPDPWIRITINGRVVRDPQADPVCPVCGDIYINRGAHAEACRGAA